MFLKFISDRYDERRIEIDKDTRDPKSDIYCKTDKQRDYFLNLKDQYIEKGVFFLKHEDKWSELARVASSEKNLGIRIDKILLDIEKDNPSLENVLPKVFASVPIPN